MANNLKISKYLIIGVDKLRRYETIIHTAGQTVAPGGIVTHEVHLGGRTIQQAIASTVEHGMNVGLLVDFTSCSALDRPSHSRALIVDNIAYYVLTYTDVLGTRHGKQCGLRRIRDGRIVYFLRCVSDNRQASLIMESVADIWQVM